MALQLKESVDIKLKAKVNKEKETGEHEMNESPTEDVAEFAGCLMTIANVAHKLHLGITGPGSFAGHLALNDLYDALPGHADSLVELYQGYYGTLVKGYETMAEEEYLAMTPVALVTWLQKYIEDERKVFGTNSMLQNQVDELLATIAKAKYKLTFLS